LHTLRTLSATLSGLAGLAGLAFLSNHYHRSRRWRRDRGGRGRIRGWARAQVQFSYLALYPKCSFICRNAADSECDCFTRETIIIRLNKQHWVAASGNRFGRDLPSVDQRCDNCAVRGRKPVYRSRS